MSDIIRIKRGLDIKIQGKAEKTYLKAERPAFCALKPLDFNGLSPKLAVNAGDKVKAGSVIFFDKYHPEVKFTSPVSGEVTEIRRGERRVIEEIVIKADDKDEFVSFNIGNPSEMTPDQISGILLESGMWPVIRQRPYSSVAIPGTKPKSFFISGFDTAPLAPDLEFILKEQMVEFQKGVDVLAKLSGAPVHLSVDASSSVSKVFSNVRGVALHKFSGPHPAGNIGVQIHHIEPINKGDVVWYASPQDVARIGSLFINGKIDNSRVIVLTGSEVLKPAYFKAICCSSVAPLIKNNITKRNNRIISGNPLTGTKIDKDSFLGFYDNQLTVIPEGNVHEFLGWALPGFDKFSFYRSFFAWLQPSKEFKVNTNLHGGERAFVLTGQYEQVIPMDIYPMQLLKSIMVEDIDQMERLGIYEVAEEDFALAEFICPSKTEMQSVIRKGLDMIRKEME